VEAPGTEAHRRTLTPAVLAAAIFTTVCALASISFVAANGGLTLPLAGTPSPGAVAAASPTAAAEPLVSPSPILSAGTPVPTLAPLESPVPSISPTPGATPAGTPDPLAVLPPCPDHPGCYEYTIRRGDSLSTIGDRWLIPVSTIEALNPQITDPSTIVVGQILYLGRTPFVRLEACPNVSGCYLYVIRPGDRLSTIAGRFGTTTTAILDANPAITDPNAIYSGQTIRLPGPEFPCCV
jgi:nucleoid-associated protein YgaU